MSAPSASLLKQPSVLVVDDEPTICMFLELLLRELGYRIAGTAFNGVEAVEMARALQPDCVILDNFMPVMNGITAAQHILAAREVPVIMCSGFANSDIQDYAKLCGIRTFIAKPFTFEQLEEALQLAGVNVVDTRGDQQELCVSAA